MSKLKMLGVYNTLADGWVLCRNYGDDLNIGDFFTHIFESKLVIKDDTAWSEITEKEALGNSNEPVYITEIKVFGQNQNCLASGFTGEIKMSAPLPTLNDTCSLGDNKTKIIHDYRLMNNTHSKQKKDHE